MSMSRKAVCLMRIVLMLLNISGGFVMEAKAQEENTDAVLDGNRLRLVASTIQVSAGEWSPDGTRIAVAFENMAIVVDAFSGLELVRMEGHENSVKSAFYSQDGQKILTHSNDGDLRVWNSLTGDCLFVIEGDFDHANYSIKTEQVTTASLWETEAQVWDVRTGKLLHLLKGHLDGIVCVRFSENGDRVLTTSRDKTIRVWDSATGRSMHVLSGFDDVVMKASFSNDDQFIVSGDFQDNIMLWDYRIGDLVRAVDESSYRAHLVPNENKLLEIHKGGVAKLTDLLSGDVIYSFNLKGSGLRWGLGRDSELELYSPGGKYFMTQAGASTCIWNTRTGEEVFAISLEDPESVLGGAFSPDDMKLLVYTGSGAYIYEVSTGEIVSKIKQSTWPVMDVVVSSNGASLVVDSFLGPTLVWDVIRGMKTHEATGVIHDSNSASFSPDGNLLAVDAAKRGWTEILNLTTGIVERKFIGVGKMCFSPDGLRLVSSAMDSESRIWDTASGELLAELIGHSGYVSTAVFSSNGKLVITASDDNTCRIWDSEMGRELAQILSFKDGSWAVIEPSTGRYDSGSDGKSNGKSVGLHWVYDNREVILLEQFKKDYWHPGLLADIWAGKELPPIKSLTKIAVYPKVKLGGDAVSSREWGDTILNGPRFDIELRDDGGGIGSVQLTVNGKLVSEDLRPRNVDQSSDSFSIPVDLSLTGLLIPGQPNTIEVRATNAESTVTSRPSVARYTPPAPEQSASKQVHVYALVVGASDYLGENLDLRFAAADAIAFADALRLAAERLVCLENDPDTNCDGLVHVRSLIADSDGSTPVADQPTRENILNELESIAKAAEPQDIVVVFFAGHGTTLRANRTGRDNADTYLFLTPGAGTWTNEDLKSIDGERVTVSGTDIEQILRRSKAVKQLLILDTCGSGGAVADLGAARNVPSEQIKELDRTASRSGVWLLAGSATNAVSYEASQFGQGVLTYALLEWLRIGELRNGEYVDVSSWFEAAADRVPDLARGIGGIQTPQIIRGFLPVTADRTSQQASFSVGRLKESDRERIHLSSPKPVFVRARLTDPDDGGDPLSLGNALNAALRLAELEGKLVSVRADRAPDAYRITGLYSSSDRAVNLTNLRVRQGDVKILDISMVAVEPEGSEKLDDAVARKIMELLEPILDQS